MVLKKYHNFKYIVKTRNRKLKYAQLIEERECWIQLHIINVG
jgi:hypothetical protein